MDNSLKEKLKSLAVKYEVCSFCDEDPSQFMRWYPINQIKDVEVASFIASMLAFGNRKQFIPKISSILTLADKTSSSVSNWILTDSYKTTFPLGSKKFYRFYSYDDMHSFFSDIKALLIEGETMGEAIHFRWDRAEKESGEKVLLADIISLAFPHSAIVPKGKNTANKRIHMFLRWMVRQNSPVDLGIWSWYSPSNLLIPLDVHVMDEGIKLGALKENARATRKTAIELTNSLKEIWKDDPCKGDFALFGLGVDKEKEE